MNKLFYQVLLLILFLQNIHSQKQRTNLPLNSIDTFSARKDKNSCDVNPSDIIPQGDYFGDCIDGKADGLGILYFNDKSAIKGYFKNNILQNSIVEFKYPKEFNTYVGLYNNGKLNGPFIYYRFSDYYSDLFVSSTNFNEGRNVDSEWDYFTIPEPIKIIDNVFPLFQEWKGVKNPIYDIIDSFEKPHEIPNSSQVLFTVRRRNNPNGYTNPSLALYDINTNTVIREFGSYTNPLNFLTFTPDFKSFYATKINLKVKKIVKVEISSGLISNVPIEQEKSIFNNLKSDKPKKSITTSKYNYKAVNDSKNNSAEFTINSLDGKINSRLQLNQKVIDNFAIDENSQKVLIVEFVNGVTQWNLYSLDNLEFIKQIHTFNSLVSGQIGFSSQGKFLYYSVENKTFLFKDYKLYFAVPGEFYGFNNDDNIILTSKRGYGVLDNLKNTPNYSTLEAYDLLNKSVLWKTKLNDSPISYGGFKVGNEFFVLTKSPGGVGDKKPHIIRYNLNYPINPDLFFKVNLNLQDEKKSILALQAQKLIEKNTSSVVNTNLSNNNDRAEKLINGTNKTKSNDRELSDVIAAEVLSSNILGNYINGVLKESKNSSSKNSGAFGSSKNSHSSSSSSTKRTCTKCGKGFEIKDFNESTRLYSNSRRETKIGFIPCSMCQGTKKMSVTAGSSYKGKGCTSCQNSGWKKCDMSSSGH